MTNPLSRREFLTRSALAGGAAAAGSLLGRCTEAPAAPAAAQFAPQEFGFFLIGDTHYLASKSQLTQADGVSAATNAGLISVLNNLPNSKIPDSIGGGTVLAPRGVIHAGDCIDSGAQAAAPYTEMRLAEWDFFVRDFGLNGADGKLRFPIYEIHGNHDVPASSDGPDVEAMIQRTRIRPGVSNRSADGLHYSWDWAHVHFINLGIVVGQVKSVTRQRRYNPRESMDFLVADLKSKVGASGRPVVITHHVDIHRYAGPCNPTAPYNSAKEFDACDIGAYYDAVRSYNIAGIFYGHTHQRNILKWNGLTANERNTSGLPIFNTTKAGHYVDPNQGLFYVHVTESELTVREIATVDRWKTMEWTPQVWKRLLARA